MDRVGLGVEKKNLLNGAGSDIKKPVLNSTRCNSSAETKNWKRHQIVRVIS